MMTRRSIPDTLYQFIGSPMLIFISFIYRYLLLLHIASISYFKCLPETPNKTTPEAQLKLVPSCVVKLWTVSDVLCKGILALSFISHPLHNSNVATSAALAVTCACCLMSICLTRFMTWHVSIASTWPNAVQNWATLCSHRSGSRFSSTPMLLAAPVAWTVWASISATTLFFMVMYNGSIAVTLERYVEFVHNMKAIISGSRSSGAPTSPHTDEYQASLLVALTVGSVVVAGIMHTSLIITRFSQLGRPLSGEDRQEQECYYTAPSTPTSP
ncbi:uncharacterized protein PHACADRAFT_259840 [Phanerochaete carnosa HHB-10118-sp]|uniref:Uncharacterized protein n=1 Tax=Phanerochaete carnosa (strain HHB-10118-sp) TaxID=650164 RepID=K5VPR7_PHACS|nr:uncharacterized protein PHACADRAFT_259840 [Phanerochaete carnosa HHB-10118-sp]EKM53448.1 hypothetical protein PHACADRAFT_259840 [Phanerochaete carnosa HHB-10118-sp]